MDEAQKEYLKKMNSEYNIEDTTDKIREKKTKSIFKT